MVKLAAVLKVKVKLLSHVQLFPTSWTVAYQVPPSMGFSRQEYWSGLPFTKASQMKADHIVNKKKKISVLNSCDCYQHLHSILEKHLNLQLSQLVHMKTIEINSCMIVDEYLVHVPQE